LKDKFILLKLKDDVMVKRVLAQLENATLNKSLIILMINALNPKFKTFINPNGRYP
jgi:hypothetical protein